MKGVCHGSTTRRTVSLVLTVLLVISLLQLILVQFVYYTNGKAKKEDIGNAPQDSSERAFVVQETARLLLRVEEAAKTSQRAAELAQKAAQLAQKAAQDVRQAVRGQNIGGEMRNAASVAGQLLDPAVQKGQMHQYNISYAENSSSRAEETVSEEEIEALTQIFLMRVQEAKERSSFMTGLRNCSLLAAEGNVRGTCVDTNCSRLFPSSAKDRVKQLMNARFRISKQQRKDIKEMARNVPPKRLIFVTAASSNHYQESQALVHNMRQHVFPKLPMDSYAFYYYDLGLTALQRRRVEKNCNCTVRTFNRTSLPPHARDLMCYAWKPVLLQALLPKAEVVVYMDVSVRFQSAMNFSRFLAGARHRGALFLSNADAIPNHTARDMFRYYGDLPCQYWPYPELLVGFSVLHNEPFVRRLLLEPWLACALHPACMCTVDPLATRICPHTQRQVGQCHRFDLSSLTLLAAKLFGPAFEYLIIRDNHPPLIRRDQTMDFFTD